ncbi:MAG: hypothetical protein RL222_1703 [Bacteroidota bacterium]|jgi:hypothetical protein
MKKIITTIFCVMTTALSIMAQQNFQTSTRHKDGLVTVYITYMGNAKQNYATQYRYGLYNEQTKKMVLPMQYQRLLYAEENNLYIVQDTTFKYGLYSTKSGNFVVSPEYNDIKPFSESVAVVMRYEGGYSKYGAIDITGKLLIPMQYSYLSQMSEGLLCFKKEKGYGFIDKKNQEVIPPMYRTGAVFKGGLACVSPLDSTYYGYINKKNEWVVKPKYLRGADFKGKYAVVFKTRDYSLNSDMGGVIDVTGKELVPCEYDNIIVYDDFFVVKKALKQNYSIAYKYGVRDFTGKEILPAEYEDISLKAGTSYYQVMKGGKYSLVDKNMQTVTADEYDYIGIFQESGVAYFKKGSKYLVVNKELKTVIPWKEARSIVMGKKNKMAYIMQDKIEVYTQAGKLLKTIEQEKVSTYSIEFSKEDDTLRYKYDNIVRLYDIPQQKATALEYTEAYDFNEDGIFIGKKSGDHYFVDYNGNKRGTKSYHSVVNFSEGICAVQDGMYSTPYLADSEFRKIKDLSCVFEGPFSEGLAKGKSQYGNTRYYINTKGDFFSVTGSDAGNFSNGRAYVKDAYNSKYFFIDRSGKKINEEQYDEVGPFSEYVAGVKKNKKTGYIDTTGKLVIPYKFDVGSPFFEGVAIVQDGTEFYLINKKGEKAGKKVYNGAKNPANGTYPVQEGTKYGLIDSKGKVLVDFKYQEITPVYEGLCWAKKDGKWGLVSSGGKELTDFIYDSGNNATDGGYVSALKDKKMGLLDKNGKTVIPFIYDSIGKVYKGKVLLILKAGSGVAVL